MPEIGQAENMYLIPTNGFSCLITIKMICNVCEVKAYNVRPIEKLFGANGTCVKLGYFKCYEKKNPVYI